MLKKSEKPVVAYFKNTYHYLHRGTDKTTFQTSAYAKSWRQAAVPRADTDRRKFLSVFSTHTSFCITKKIAIFCEELHFYV